MDGLECRWMACPWGSTGTGVHVKSQIHQNQEEVCSSFQWQISARFDEVYATSDFL